MSTYVLTATGLGPTSPYLIYLKRQAWQGMGVGLLVNFSGSPNGAAVATGTVQVTCDPAILSQAASTQATARWNNHDTLVNLTNDKNSSIAYPVLAVRLNLTAWTSGSVTLGIGVPDEI